jgi:3-phenylpropionate/cinnamic acid dioxygenase small subunit
MSEAMVAEGPAVAAPPRVRIPTGSAEHFRIVEFLEEEAALLDEARLQDWLELLDADLIYRMPTRETRYSGKGDGFAKSMFNFDENKATITMKALRLATFENAWAENPPSRTRRFVTNIRAFQTAEANAFEVSSSILLVRSRENMDFISARRDDLLADHDGVLKLRRRTIWVDQTVLHTSNLAVFL